MPKNYKRIEDDGIKRAALYIRVSTEEQAMHGLSLPAQHENLTAYVAENGLRVVGVYTDEGITARKKYRNRTAFMRMLNDVKDGKIDLILFIKLDRWFRNIADYYEIQKILDDHNVRWIATEEDYDTTTANGRLHLNIKLSIAQDESDRTSERIKFVFESKVKHGEVISGKVPLGYKIENRRLAIDAENADIARDIFDRYIAIRSLCALRKYVMEKHGLVYCYSGLKALLQNERYIGCAHNQDDFCPAIVDAEVFKQAQSMITARAERSAAQRTDRVYLFSGLVYCAECGNRLSSSAANGKYIYYRCTRYEKLHLCTHKKRSSELILEDWLLHNIVSQFAQYNLDLEAKAAQPQQKVDTAKIKRKMEKLKDLYLNDLIDRDAYEQDYTSLRDELQSASAVPNALPRPVDIDVVIEALSLYSQLQKQSKKEFWSKVLVNHKIVITNDDDFSIVPFSPY